MFQDVHENDTSHMGIIGSLMVVGEESLSLVVAALVLSVETPPQIVLELVVTCTLLVNLA